MKDIDAICCAWWRIVCKKYKIVATIMNCISLLFISIEFKTICLEHKFSCNIFQWKSFVKNRIYQCSSFSPPYLPFLVMITLLVSLSSILIHCHHLFCCSWLWLLCWSPSCGSLFIVVTFFFTSHGHGCGYWHSSLSPFQLFFLVLLVVITLLVSWLWFLTFIGIAFYTLLNDYRLVGLLVMVFGLHCCCLLMAFFWSWSPYCS